MLSASKCRKSCLTFLWHSRAAKLYPYLTQPKWNDLCRSWNFPCLTKILHCEILDKTWKFQTVPISVGNDPRSGPWASGSVLPINSKSGSHIGALCQINNIHPLPQPIFELSQIAFASCMMIMSPAKRIAHKYELQQEPMAVGDRHTIPMRCHQV